MLLLNTKWLRQPLKYRVRVGGATWHASELTFSIHTAASVDYVWQALQRLELLGLEKHRFVRTLC